LVKLSMLWSASTPVWSPLLLDSCAASSLIGRQLPTPRPPQQQQQHLVQVRLSWLRILVVLDCFVYFSPSPSPLCAADLVEQKLQLALLNVATSARLCALQKVDFSTGVLEATFDVFGAPAMLLRQMDWSVLTPLYKEGESSSAKGMRSKRKKVDLIARDKRGGFELLFVEVKPSSVGAASDLLKLQKMCKDAFDSRFTRTPNSRKSALVRSFAVYGMLVTGLDVQLFGLRRPFPGGYSFGREADFSVPLKLGGLTELQQLFRVVCTVAALVGMLEAHCVKDEVGSNDGGDGDGNGGGGGDSGNADGGGGDDSGGGSPRDGGSGPGWGGPSVPPTRPTPQKPSKKQGEGKGTARGVLSLLSDPPAWLANEQRPRHKFKRDVWALPTRRETCRIELVSLEGKPCVLKVYDLRPSWTLALANAELQVLLAARRLGLPHVVRLMDVFIDDTVGPELVFVLPRLQGVDTRFARGIIDNVEVGLRKLGVKFSQLLQGLAGLHAAGFAHGDVSPNNVMLDSDSGSLVWIDFGYSRVTSQCGPRKGCGTPGFIAPDSPTDCVTGTEPDIWALGCLLGRALADVVASLPGSSRWSAVCGVLARAGRDPDELACLPELIASAGAPGLGEKAVFAGVCLVARLTESNGARRLTAAQALDDIFFQLASQTCASEPRNVDDRAGGAVISLF
jgi:uncharacterized membrane protein YgcG